MPKKIVCFNYYFGNNIGHNIEKKYLFVCL